MMMNIIIMNFGGGGGCEWCASRYRLGLPGRCYRGARHSATTTMPRNLNKRSGNFLPPPFGLVRE